MYTVTKWDLVQDCKVGLTAENLRHHINKFKTKSTRLSVEEKAQKKHLVKFSTFI